MIEISDLYCRYGTSEILRGINLRIESGEFLGIIGPNGAGKTSLIKCILRLNDYDGVIKVDGIDLKNYSLKSLARKISYLPSEIYSIYNYSVYEIICMGRFPYQWFSFELNDCNKGLIEKYLEISGIKYLKDRSINSLSSGERQLVFLTQMLVQETPIMILDEPTVHLDMSHQIKVFEILKRLNTQNKTTVIFVHHDINLTSYFAKKILVLKEGSVFDFGTPREVLSEKSISQIYDLSGDTRLSIYNSKEKPQVFF